MSTHGKVCWTELNTWDPEKAKAYYAAVMGWTFDEVPTAGAADNPRPYYVAKKDGEAVAGIFTMFSPDFDTMRDHWFSYIAVDDVKAAIASSNANGGKVYREPFEIPGFGTLSIVADANGAAMGFLQPASAQVG